MFRILSKDKREQAYKLIKKILKKAQSRENPHEVSVDVEYIMKIGDKQGWCCALSGTPMQFVSGVGKKNPYILTIDRKDSSKGYVKNNIQLLVWQVNYAKGNYSTKQFIKMCKLVVKEAA